MAAPATGGAPATQPPALSPAATGQPRFRRLTTAEQLERRRQGLCFNCDEQYARGHVCKRLFYLETVDEYATAEDEGAVPPEDSATPVEEPTANALVVSMYALAGIRTENTMLLPVSLKGERLLALLDTGSTHTFLQGHVMRRLGLSSLGAAQLHVTVASGERLPCEGIGRDIPLSIGGASYPVTCVGLALGCFDFIIGVDFLRTLGPLTWGFDGHTVS